MRHRQGFSILELVIVLTIAAFLISAIVSGIEMLKQAKLRNIVTEAQGYMDAINLFHSKYNELPGDSVRAFSIWGTQCATIAADCNGNGDGHITHNVSGTTRIESLRAWQHLSLAEMIKGKYSGIATTTGQSDVGINIPSSSYTPAGWGFDFAAPYAPPSAEGQYLSFGAAQTNNAAIANILIPSEAQSIDTKIDDGYPRNGFVLSSGTVSGTGCYSTNTVSAVYNISVNSKVCMLKFIFQKY